MDEKANRDYAKAKVDLGGVVKFEFEGKEEFVQRNMDKYLKPFSDVAKQLSRREEKQDAEQTYQPALFGTVDTSPTTPSSDVSTETNKVGNNGNSLGCNSETPDLPSFYLNMAPKKQTEEIAVIFYWCEKYDKKSDLNKEELGIVYDQLKPAGLKKPDDKALKRMVDNAIGHDKYLWRVGGGRYSLTIQGREFVENMNQFNEEK